MDILQLYNDFSITTAPEGHKHARNGWVNVECPHCTGSEGYHLGYSLASDYYVCWRCGSHPITPTLSKLLSKPEYEIRILIRQYGITLSHAPLQKVVARRKAFKFPTETGPLLDNHIRYLQSRNFDPDYLIDLWQLKGTGPLSKLDNIEYKHRIIIPYIWDSQTVSFDSRSISIFGSDKMRYKACPKDRELIEHKNILYGRQDKWKETGILVEGPTDVWRLGTSSFAVSGIKYTPKQVRLIGSIFKRVPVCFDADPQAILQANKIVAELKFRGVDAFRVDIEGDPGSMKQEDANYLVKQLMK